ncbi:PTS sugar transporter subunit IIC [Clostridium sp. D2Q-14]|uniref:PTS sugar transporter subunit IIC n=1 Tax=Anaeromonas gelatinilytica TaxID=2683194 RepID=UPI00193B60DB|nr:PTS sugar transporter subunit IIC [Anaeromonas gelatinilytica]MBS4535453.1 PTS sugar transporter subunit IIC [Anaeromonas gelatinilytica]
MNKFTQWMEQHFLPVAAKIGSQRHLVAIRDAFIGIMPITMVGSVAVLLNVFFRDLPTEWGATSFVETMAPIIGINGNVWFGSIAIIALVFVFSLGYNIAKSYDVNPLAGGIIAFSSFIVTLPQTANFLYALPGVSIDNLDALTELGVQAQIVGENLNIDVSGWGYIGLSYAGASGLFTALIIGFISSMIYVKLMLKGITIKLPDSVPSAVNKAFAAIIPGIIAVYVAATLGYLSVTYLGFSINDLILEYIQKPLLGLSQGLFSVILTTFLIQVFWFFGLHGPNVLAPIMDGVYLPALVTNTEAYEAAQSAADLPYIWTRVSFDAYSQMGGSGITLALIIAIFIFSKRKDSKTIAKLGAPMGLFNINEPIVFGMPIVLNPFYIIPWLIIPPITATIAYLLTAAGIIPPTFVAVPWVMPVGVLAYLATGGSWLAGLASIFNLFISFVIWSPFVILANRVNKVDKEDKQIA